MLSLFKQMVSKAKEISWSSKIKTTHTKNDFILCFDDLSIASLHHSKNKIKLCIYYFIRGKSIHAYQYAYIQLNRVLKKLDLVIFIDVNEQICVLNYEKKYFIGDKYKTLEICINEKHFETNAHEISSKELNKTPTTYYNSISAMAKAIKYADLGSIVDVEYDIHESDCIILIEFETGTEVLSVGGAWVIAFGKKTSSYQRSVELMIGSVINQYGYNPYIIGEYVRDPYDGEKYKLQKITHIMCFKDSNEWFLE